MVVLVYPRAERGEGGCPLWWGGIDRRQTEVNKAQRKRALLREMHAHVSPPRPHPAHTSKGQEQPPQQMQQEEALQKHRMASFRAIYDRDILRLSMGPK